QGFPMKNSMQGPARKKALLKKGTGFRADRKGKMQRKTVRGNTVSAETQQLNLAIIQAGDPALFEQLIPKQKAEEQKVSVKEQMIKESLENVGNTELAHEALKIKPKSRR
ncbi:MAG: S6e family ribosomal protein, partial [Candidatus ainarchaeum sp.]|nr:S6e family ribosomal protein [Candidatus ainarchaeum sp.]